MIMNKNLEAVKSDTGTGSKRREWEERLDLVLDIAEQRVMSGAEVARTE